MATITNIPEHITVPNVTSGDLILENEQKETFVAEVKAYCKNASSCPDAGEIVSFPIGEDDVNYAVLSYSELINIEAWSKQLSEAQIEGLSGEDILIQVKHEKELREVLNI